MKKIITFSFILLSVAAIAGGMKSNKVGNGSFPAATKTTQDAYLQSQGIPPEDQARCAAAGYPASSPTCPQTNLSITTPSTDQLKVGQTFTLPVSGGNGAGALVVSASGSCTSSGSSVTISAPGSCAITAYKAAAGAYATGAPQNLSVTTTKGVPTIQFAGTVPSSLQTLGTVSLSATSSSGAAVSYSVTSPSPAPCSISGTTLTANTPGSCIVTASSAATANYEAVTNSTTISISGQLQTSAVSATISPSAIGPNQTRTLSGSGGDGSGAGVYTFTSLTPTVCSITGSSTLTTAASPPNTTCTIRVVRAASGAYVASSPQDINFTLDTTSPTVAAGNGPFAGTDVYGAATGTPTVYTFVASDPSGVTYSIASGLTGFAINSSTGVVTKTSASVTAGTVTGTLRATDNAGNFVDRTLNVTVFGNLSVTVDNVQIIATASNQGYGNICNPGSIAETSNGSPPLYANVTVTNAIGPVTFSMTSATSEAQVYTPSTGSSRIRVTIRPQGQSPNTTVNYQVTATTPSGQSAQSAVRSWKCL